MAAPHSPRAVPKRPHRRHRCGQVALRRAHRRGCAVPVRLPRRRRPRRAYNIARPATRPPCCPPARPARVCSGLPARCQGFAISLSRCTHSGVLGASGQPTACNAAADLCRVGEGLRGAGPQAALQTQRQPIELGAARFGDGDGFGPRPSLTFSFAQVAPSGTCTDAPPCTSP